MVAKQVSRALTAARVSQGSSGRQRRCVPLRGRLNRRAATTARAKMDDDRCDVLLLRKRAALLRLDCGPFAVAYAVLHARAWAGLGRGQPTYSELVAARRPSGDETRPSRGRRQRANAVTHIREKRSRARGWLSSGAATKRGGGLREDAASVPTPQRIWEAIARTFSNANSASYIGSQHRAQVPVALAAHLLLFLSTRWSVRCARLVAYVRRADRSPMNRGDAAAAT